MSNDYILIIAAIITGVLFPIYTLFEGKKARDFLVANPTKLTRILIESIVFLLLALIIVLAAMLMTATSFEQIGLGFARSPQLLLALILVAMLSVFLFHKIKIHKKDLPKLNSQLVDIRYLMPKNQTEYKATIVTSFVAGFSEEIVFRGFLLWQMSQFLPPLLAVLIVNGLFALAHFATKFKNLVSAFILGMIFSLLYYLTDSLWLAILAHTVVDIYSCTLGYKVHRANKRAEV